MDIDELEAYLKLLSHNTRFNNLLFIDSLLTYEQKDVHLIYYFVLLTHFLEEKYLYYSNVVKKLDTNKTSIMKYSYLLLNYIIDIRSLFSEKEIEYIYYLRHTACPIFQNGYEYGNENCRLKIKR